MAEAYDVLAGLNRMLESQERREQTKLQTSLAFMQFAQAKRMQDIQVAGQQLTLLQAANTQMMGSQAQAFLSETGLDSYYLQTQQEDPSDGVKKLVNKLKSGKIGFKKEEAERIASAIYASKAGTHGPILKIGQELYGTAVQQIAEPGVGIDNLYKSFTKISPGLSVDRLESINKTATNQRMILKEMMEMGKGDYEIQSDIGLVEEIPEDVIESLDKLDAKGKFIQKAVDEGGFTEDEAIEYWERANVAGAGGIEGLPGAKSILTGTDLSEDVKSYDNQIKALAVEIEGQYEDIRNTDDQVRMINAKRESNIPLLQIEEDFLNTSPQLKSLAEAEIKNLNSQINDLREDQRKYERAEDKYSVHKLTDVVMQETTPLGF